MSVRPSLRPVLKALLHTHVCRSVGDVASFDWSIHITVSFWLRILQTPSAKLRLANSPGAVAIIRRLAMRHLQTHRSENVHWFSGANWLLRRQLRLLTTQMQMHVGPRQAMLRAFFIMQSSLDHQAELWAYVDVFRYLALLCALCIPAAFLLKRPKREAKGTA
jgi:hypothetical protein